MNVTLIANPVAGSGKAGRQIQKLVQILDRRGDYVETFITQAAGDARRSASRIEPGSGTIVVAGGDGTLNEVINGVADPSTIPIVLLPTGTANVLAHELGLPSDPEEVAGILAQGVVRKLDMGMIDDRRFMLMVSTGFDAMVTERIQRGRKGLGYIGYVRPLLGVLAHYRAPKLRITVDGREGLKGALVVVATSETTGESFQSRIEPAATQAISMSVYSRAVRYPHCAATPLAPCVAKYLAFPRSPILRVSGSTWNPMSQLR
ncbi:MAG: diacylglycerol kinase family protein [Candidatus Binatia bacterium]